MFSQKFALAVHDISCVGRCSLTVALPILSAAGIQCGCLPTAVLSTHTGGFTGYTYRDLTEDVRPIEQHWQSLGLEFDAIYSGYLGSAEQIALVEELFRNVAGESSLRLVDPVMADNGKLYPGFAPEFPGQMKELCAHADIIIPNLTEACLMLDLPYREGPFEESYVQDILGGLSEIGNAVPVLTGVWFDKENLGTACLENGTVSYVFARRRAGMYHGTGDVWGSSFLAAKLNGKSISESCRIACEYTAECVSITSADKSDARFGVRFEAALPKLMKDLRLL